MRFTATLRDGGRGRVLVPVPFDPDEVWTAKPRHHVNGSLDGKFVRGIIERHGEEWGFLLGPAWVRDCGAVVGKRATVVIEAEGPQRGDLAEDFADALAADPAAGAFWDGLAQFYRKAYLRWIDGTKRNPDERARRIAQAVTMLAAGVKDHRHGPPA